MEAGLERDVGDGFAGRITGSVVMVAVGSAVHCDSRQGLWVPMSWRFGDGGCVALCGLGWVRGLLEARLI